MYYNIHMYFLYEEQALTIMEADKAQVLQPEAGDSGEPVV